VEENGKAMLHAAAAVHTDDAVRLTQRENQLSEMLIGTLFERLFTPTCPENCLSIQQFSQRSDASILAIVPISCSYFLLGWTDCPI
jgi:hypothetical protein